jgi:malto-oligosyltrehalose trehalohydrolase
MKRSHSMAFGAELQADGNVRFRLWAPGADRVELSVHDFNVRLVLENVGAGWFERTTGQVRIGSLYTFRINRNAEVPDPASRFQPFDVHGPSEVVDPASFEWNDHYWRGRPWEEAVIYELHVGAFTPEGTFRAIEAKLEHLSTLGITAIELLPVSDFRGSRNWGYDGVLPFAPDSSYGRPEDFKHLIQAAHAVGLMVFLDVVYNHFGPEGNYLHLYAPQFFTERHRTPWGDGINFDGPGSRVVRDFFIHNALYWVEEYHLDGLRLDAVHTIADDSHPDILTELAESVREKLGNDRAIHLVLENDNNAAKYLRNSQDHIKLYNAQWNDDIHHAIHVLLTGESDGYYADYVQHPVEQLGRCLTEGFGFQGEYSAFRGTNRGEPSTDLPPFAFVSFLQNHDQIGNRAFGDRIMQIAAPEAVKAAMEILLLAPSPPLLFMGEEFAAASPFLYFCDFKGELAHAVTEGRRNEFARFAEFNSSEVRSKIPDPNDEETFLSSKLNWDSLLREFNARWITLYRELLAIRKREIIPRLKRISTSRREFTIWKGGGLSTSWITEDKLTLHLAANLTSNVVRAASASGRRFYFSSEEASRAFDDGHLLPWTVIWSFSSQSNVSSEGP